jgi:isocitrate dehydrogenase
LAGSIGLAGSANIGDHVAMFEAVHGSAPDIAGQAKANPSALLLAAIQMLTHLGQGEVAVRLHNAWLKTIEDGVHTADIFKASQSTTLASTHEFADAVIARLGEGPSTLKPVAEAKTAPLKVSRPSRTKVSAKKTLVGVDVFVHFREPHARALAELIKPHAGPAFSLQMITNRGVKVWPDGHPETFCTDHWRCRFKTAPDWREVSHGEVAALMARLSKANIEFIKTEHLYDFDDVAGYTLGQGQ